MQTFDHNIGVLDKRQFFAENWQNPQKIVIEKFAPRPNNPIKSDELSTIL
jgi:hypothetical protein